MGDKAYPGEFEHMVLLAILRLKGDAYGPDISAFLEQNAEREVSRGALYSALQRMERKGHLTWKIEAATPSQRGHPKRLFSLTKLGLETLRQNRQVLLRLWEGVESVLAVK